MSYPHPKKLLVLVSHKLPCMYYDNNGAIKHKMKSLVLCMFLLFAFVSTASLTHAQASLAITEIMYNPEGTDSGGKVSDGTYFSHEWIEVLNISSGAIDLTEWKFNDGANHVLNVPPEKGGQGSMLIPSGGYVIITDDAATFLEDHSGFSGTVIDTVMNLTNTSKIISLIDASSITIDSVTYQNTWGADENGHTLEKIVLTEPNNTTNWKESARSGGTPGEQNSMVNQPPENQPSNSQPVDQPPTNQSSSNQTENTPPQAKALVERTEIWVNEEIEFDGSQSSDANTESLVFNWNFGDDETSIEKTTTHSYPDPGKYNVVLNVSDGQFESYDFITIRVAEPQFSKEVTINEFIPNPKGSDAEHEWIELKNQSGETIDLGGWWLDDADGGSSAFTIPNSTTIAPKEFLVFRRTQTKIALNNDVDAVRLIWPNGVISEEVTYNESKEGWPVIRVGNSWEWTDTPTPGAENILQQKSTIVKTKTDSPSQVGPKRTFTVPPLSEIGARTDEKDNEDDEYETTTRISEKNANGQTAALANPSSPPSQLPYRDIGIALGVSILGSFALMIARKKLKIPE